MTKINSPLFGETYLLDADEEQFQQLETLIRTFPANAAGMLNRMMNEKGFMFTISCIERTKDGA